MGKKWTPYVYQKPIIKAVTSALRSVGHALMVMATGTGKTPTSAFAVKETVRDIKNPNVLVLAHMNELLTQAKKNYEGVFDGGYTYGIYNGEEKCPQDTNFIFASFQSMVKVLKEFSPRHFDMIVVDESHHATADGFHKVIKYFRPKYLLGMTATPDREKGLDIRKVFGEEVAQLLLTEAIARGYLTPVTYRVITDNLDEKALKLLAKDVIEKGERLSLSEVNKRVFIKARDEQAAEIIRKENKKAIIFCASIEHAQNFASLLPDAEVCHSGNSRDHNRWVIDGFKFGAVKHILTVDMFNEGVDVPDTEMLVFMRATSSKRIFYQQLGRGLRLSEGKSSVLVLDFVANVERVKEVKSLVDGITDEVTPGEPTEGNDRESIHISGAGFDFNFNQQVTDLVSILERLEVEFYLFPEFLEACKRRKFTSRRDYLARYKIDPKLPSSPHEVYGKDWTKAGGFACVSGKEIKRFYSFSEFLKACKRHKFTNREDYLARYKIDPQLTSNPYRYGKDWKDAGGWVCVTGNGWYSFPEFLKVCKRHKFTGVVDYQTRYRIDPKLPSTPSKVYGKDWINAGKWVCVSGREIKNICTFPEFLKACKRHKFTTGEDYKVRHKIDPKLPSSPYDAYGKDWKDAGGWVCVTGRGWYSFPEFLKACKRHKFTGVKDYKTRYKIDSKLPCHPEGVYDKDWTYAGGWACVSVKKKTS
jgi:superfamily II DNA or RNA helicase